MVSDICKLTILGAGVGIFLILFGLYGLFFESDQKIQQAENNKILLEAANRLNDVTLEVDILRKKCFEDIPKENEQEYSNCLSNLNQKGFEVTAAQINYYEIITKLGLE
jgi:hypothetical protein